MTVATMRGVKVNNSLRDDPRHEDQTCSFPISHHAMVPNEENDTTNIIEKNLKYEDI